MSNEQTGLLIVGLGIVIVVIGVVVWLGGLSWLGHLPGDIRIEGESTKVIIPLGTMIVVSLLLTIGLNVVVRILRRFF